MPSSPDLEASLLRAATAGEIKAVLSALSNGADVHARGPRGSTALHRAVLAPCHAYKVCRTLLAEGASAQALDMDGLTPLQIAMDASSNRWALAELLLDAGASPNAQPNPGRPEAAIYPLHAAIAGKSQADLPLIELLLERGADANARNHRDKTPLQLALELGVGRMEVVARLLSAKADPDALDSAQRAPLFVALGAGPFRLELTRALLEAGANPNIANLNRSAPLHLALQDKGAAVALTLLLLKANADPNALDGGSNQASALHLALAAEADRLELTQALLAAGATPNLSGSAARHHTPLMMAMRSSKSSAELTAALLSAGANANELSPSYGYPLIAALGAEGNETIVEALLKAPSKADPNLKTQSREPALHIALSSGSGSSRLEYVRALLRAGADPNALSSDRLSPLAVAYKARNGRDELLRSLLAHGADPDAALGHGESVWAMAQRLKNAEAIRAIEDFRAGLLAPEQAPLASPEPDRGAPRSLMSQPRNQNRARHALAPEQEQALLSQLRSMGDAQEPPELPLGIKRRRMP